MNRFLKNVRISPVFKREFKFIGLLRFDYGEVVFLMILPTLGFKIDWSGVLINDLNKLDWN
jgi:hypothetical protein